MQTFFSCLCSEFYMYFVIVGSHRYFLVFEVRLTNAYGNYVSLSWIVNFRASRIFSFQYLFMVLFDQGLLDIQFYASTPKETCCPGSYCITQNSLVFEFLGSCVVNVTEHDMILFLFIILDAVLSASKIKSRKGKDERSCWQLEWGLFFHAAV
ncbi:hypothetical protein QUC31_009049 [Theobroma cacao]